MDNFFEKNHFILKIFVYFVIYLIYYCIEKISSKRKATDTIHTNHESGKSEDHFPSPPHTRTTQTLPTSKPSIVAAQSLQHSQAHTSTSIQDKLMLMPSYPGIKKLVLSVQNQDTYKLYQATSLQRTHQLNTLLRKYTTTQKSILIHEIFMHKT